MSKLRFCFAAVAALFSLGLSLQAQAPPLAVLDNGKMKVTVYLPDAKTGFYRCARFDWAGMVKSVEFDGHTVYGQWFDSVDPALADIDYRGDQIVAGPCTAAVGVPEEFNVGRTSWGFDEAKPGESFLKIGVGLLRKPGDGMPYNRFLPYELVDDGKWTVKKSASAIEFSQSITDAKSGYGYVYTKRLVLAPGKRQMLLEHSLRNTGTKVLDGQVYNHNFMRFDGQASNPDFVVRLPYPATAQVQAPRPGAPQPASPAAPTVVFQGNQINFAKTLVDKERGGGFFTGFGAEAKDYDFRIENRKLGMGLRITADQPLSQAMLWAIRPVFAVEPFLKFEIAPGASYNWALTYDYYTLAAEGR